MTAAPATKSQTRQVWSDNQISELTEGTMSDAKIHDTLRATDSRGMNPMSYAVLRTARRTESLTALLSLLDPLPEGEGRLEQLLSTLEAVLDRLDRIEMKLDALGAQGASTTSGPSRNSPRPVPGLTGGSGG